MKRRGHKAGDIYVVEEDRKEEQSEKRRELRVKTETGRQFSGMRRKTEDRREWKGAGATETSREGNGREEEERREVRRMSESLE